MQIPTMDRKITEELWVLQWGPYKGRGGNFHIEQVGGMLENAAVTMRHYTQHSDDLNQRIWIPIFIGHTFKSCVEVLDFLEKKGF
jgi:hypothetical protein